MHGSAQDTASRQLSRGLPRDLLAVLPEELWLHIFRSALLNKKDRTRCSLTCRAFRKLAQPLLFHAVLVRIPDSVENMRTKLQLAFIASPTIAPSILHVTLNGGLAINDPHHVDQTLLRSLCGFLSSLTCLQTIHIRRTNIMTDLLSTVLAISTLRNISIEDCDVFCDLNKTTRVPFKAVWFMHCSPITPRLQALVTFLAAGSVHELSLASGESSQLQDFLRIAAPRRSLKRLALDRNALYDPGFYTAVRSGRYDTLTSLIFRPVELIPPLNPVDRPPTLHPSVLPNLAHLEAELADIRVFSGRRLTQLTIHYVGVMRHPHHVELIHEAVSFPSVLLLKIRISGCLSETSIFSLLDWPLPLHQLDISCSMLTRQDSLETAFGDEQVSTLTCISYNSLSKRTHQFYRKLLDRKMSLDHLPESVVIAIHSSPPGAANAGEGLPNFLPTLRHKYPKLKHFAFAGETTYVHWTSPDHRPKWQHHIEPPTFQRYKIPSWAW